MKNQEFIGETSSLSTKKDLLSTAYLREGSYMHLFEPLMSGKPYLKSKVKWMPGILGLGASTL